jgi:hypothetical protein
MTMPDPIFILGITPRSGTAFLSWLLQQHPDCTAGHGVAEPNLVYVADQFAAVVDRLMTFWRDAGTDETRATVLRAIGDSLVGVLRERAAAPDKHLLIKTPTVYNLNRFFELFPDARLVILVRDGRAVTESSVQSFDMRYEKAMRRWTQAADVIADFRRSYSRRSEQWTIVRYEDLVADVTGSMERLLDELGLDPDDYDFAAAQDSPVLGSSVAKGGEDKVHWNPVEKPRDFDPLERFAGWSESRHRRFNWISGDRLRDFGYEPQHAKPSMASGAKNVCLDLIWPLQNVAAKLFHYRYRLLDEVSDPGKLASDVAEIVADVLWRVGYVDAFH